MAPELGFTDIPSREMDHVQHLSLVSLRWTLRGHRLMKAGIAGAYFLDYTLYVIILRDCVRGTRLLL